MICLILSLSAAGCTQSGQPQDSGAVTIVTSFYPLYIFTKNLTQGLDNVAVVNMTEQHAGCLHDYQLLSKDMKALSRADLFVVNGAGMESFLSGVTQQLPELRIAVASEGIPLLGGEEEEDARTDERGTHGHAHEENGHVWLSVPLARRQVETVGAALVELLPGQAAALSANQEAYLARLDALDLQIRAGLAAVQGREIVSFHEAYDYFAHEYGLTVAASIESDDGGEPGTRDLAALVALIETRRIGALFIEPAYQGSSAALLAAETGAAVYTLDPVTSGADSLTAYEEIMLQNMQTIREALA